MFSSWKEEIPRLIHTVIQYVENPIMHNPFHAPSFGNSKKGLSFTLHGLFQDRSAFSSPSIYVLLLQTFLEEETRTVTIGVLFNNMLLSECDPTIKRSGGEGTEIDCSRAWSKKTKIFKP